ncbi:hypothetical protein Phi13:2_gp031 [Cellulophaga phage phi13:2]|uniref:Uncharacterized protein n=2 Tax=Baltivirus TaxID=2946816 RepID=S0A2L9_9CAUD|nr:hypothetical protein Phi19:3_gp030 [Cellulophaga phage phi19:3]YP_008242056.1 hypothetical protein Phi13:2_gp031 [Cellulophaga phage phi13:2]AGO47434.1 hypothetical protein Phi19:3_gp030 [Cellulophaga phage phi19:3]AGO49641.1 hypothetical protein Phi13:2_gp031 [Cellulophaga phage phi13:2]
MKLNRNSKISKYFLYPLLYVVLTIPFALFAILYYSSKITRSLSYLCVFKIESAKQEITDFWSIETALGDVF